MQNSFFFVGIESEKSARLNEPEAEMILRVILFFRSAMTMKMIKESQPQVLISLSLSTLVLFVVEGSFDKCFRKLPLNSDLIVTSKISRLSHGIAINLLSRFINHLTIEKDC